jgi:hypothetical protein
MFISAAIQRHGATSVRRKRAASSIFQRAPFGFRSPLMSE